MYFDRDAVGAENIARVCESQIRHQTRPPKYMPPVEASGLIQSSSQLGSRTASAAAEESSGSSVAQSPLDPYVFDASHYFQSHYFQGQETQVTESATASQSQEVTTTSAMGGESRKRRVEEDDGEEGSEEARRPKKAATVTGRSSSGSGPSQQ
jgi:hypothetical protein